MAGPPRYVPHRALPAVGYLPGRGERPRLELAPTCTPHVLDWRDREGYRWGLDLFNHGFAWEAHEAWELQWAASPPGSVERARLAGLIQLAAAVVQRQLGRESGVATLGRRAAHNLVAAGDAALADAVTAWAGAGAALPVLAP